jgi:hypothetical protein
LAIIVGMSLLLSPANCGSIESPGGLDTAPYIACCIFAGLLLMVGAGYRVWRLATGPRRFATSDWSYVAVAVIVIIGGLALPILVGWPGGGVLTFDLLAPIAFYLTMVVGFLSGRDSEDLGLIVPITLVLVGLLICLPLVGVIVGFHEGALC